MTTKQSISKDALGDRMKMYEKAEAGRRFMPGIPIVARIDGRAFHSFTKGLERPYDTALHECMKRTCIALVDKTDANCGYTQSDEITLTWLPSNPETQIWFGGRIAKMTSQLAALATVYFNKYVQELLPEDYANKLPTFDARVWQVPSADEGANTFLWREWDATKNSISMAAHAHFSHKSLHGLSGRDKVDRLLNEKGSTGMIFQFGLSAELMFNAAKKNGHYQLAS